MVVSMLQKFRQYPFDFAGVGLILVASPGIYIYGVNSLIPSVLEKASVITQAIAYLAATWCLFGILAHLYCVRTRHSSIQGRYLPQPVVATEDNNDPTSTNYTNADGLRRRLQDINKTIGQQFMAKPFGSDEAWHICPKCEVYVPNRCWHCSSGCNTCILRRDHHCVFAMACVGEENHSNFLGLVLHLAIGTVYATVMLMLYSVKNLEISCGWFLLKAFVPAIFMWIDFSLHYFMCSLCLLGSLFSIAVFFAYLLGAAKGLTSADQKYSTSNRISIRGASYQKLEQFLGRNPFWRIIWPFHRIYRIDYAQQSRNY